MTCNFDLNGRLLSTEVQPGMTLFELLRREGVFSVKKGCDHGESGACTVLVNDLAMNASLLLAVQVDGSRIETIENLSTHDELHPLQEAFVAEGAAQCGYCTPGMILSLEALDREDKDPDSAQVKEALNGNLCRCTGYEKPVTAYKKLRGLS